MISGWLMISLLEIFSLKLMLSSQFYEVWKLYMFQIEFFLSVQSVRNRFMSMILFIFRQSVWFGGMLDLCRRLNRIEVIRMVQKVLWCEEIMFINQFWKRIFLVEFWMMKFSRIILIGIRVVMVSDLLFLILYLFIQVIMLIMLVRKLSLIIYLCRNCIRKCLFRLIVLILWCLKMKIQSRQIRFIRLKLILSWQVIGFQLYFVIRVF